ncbi:hypothetical protein IEQ34_005079 [Dendrobium chrysotoxum]|uniref:Uncharacterized protein n=1 Tax=Dendrobium chrysotoxum TaxID=161865 RepID=A0AAV7H8P2_DENCH|nr:hypothetical protein IEQ34_005079 [Dendrobium chrysotoxum]
MVLFPIPHENPLPEVSDWYSPGAVSGNVPSPRHHLISVVFLSKAQIWSSPTLRSERATEPL